jgi:GLPGLI family protein
MKRILIIVLVCFSLLAQAQMKEGKITYERTIQMQFRGGNQMRGNAPPMPPGGGGNNPRGNNMPRERKDKFELSFANNQSLWESVPNMDEAENDLGGGGEGGMRVMRFMGGGDENVYYNYTTGKRIDKRELNQKNYIVEDSLKKINWKLTGETKTILGHKVQKAKAEKVGTRFIMAMENGAMKRQEVPDTLVMNAWFATDIPVAGGPEYGGQLPGMILELNMNNGRTVYQAIEISPKVNASSIKEPKGGKHISGVDYNKEQERVMEEMRRNMPAGGRRIVVQGGGGM